MDEWGQAEGRQNYWVVEPALVRTCGGYEFSLRLRRACGVVVGITEDRRLLIDEDDDMDLHGFAVVVLLRSSATPRCRQVKEGAGKIETRFTSYSGKPKNRTQICHCSCLTSNL